METSLEFKILYSLPFQYPLITFCDPYLHDISYLYLFPFVFVYIFVFFDKHFLPVASSSDPCLIFSFS